MIIAWQTDPSFQIPQLDCSKYLTTVRRFVGTIAGNEYIPDTQFLQLYLVTLFLKELRKAMAKQPLV